MRRRSIVFYALIGLVAQCLLLIGAVAVILGGPASQGVVIAVVLTAGIVVPVVVTVLLLRYSIVPLCSSTSTVRRLAAGDQAARVSPGGPAETWDLAASINLLADESDRVQAMAAEQARLQALVRDAAVRIREHLKTPALTKEAVADIATTLRCDRVWLSVISEGRVNLPEGNPEDAELHAALAQEAQQAYMNAMSIMDLFRNRTSLRVNLRSDEFLTFPPAILDAFLHMGGTYLLLVPFGAGTEPLGVLALLRNNPGSPWTAAEVAAAEALAGDIGRGIDHARLYQKEQQVVAELRAVDRAKTSLLASASHDVRTPLTSIIGYLEILREGDAGPLTAEQGQMLAVVSRNAERLRSLTEDMLTTARIEMGTFRSDLRPTDLAPLLPRAAEALRPALREKKLVLDFACPGSGLMVNGDSDQLDRVLTNLLSNAVKYTPGGGVITLVARREGEEAMASVADTGIGIPGSEQPSLFTPFFRASNAVDSSIPGSGLGLSIVRTIVENHHGSIVLRSEQGKGTTVTIRIPLLGNRQQTDKAMVLRDCVL